MRTEIISCKTIHLELQRAMRETGCCYPVHELDSGLHNVPRRLTDALQAQLDALQCDRVLLGFGFCGNAMVGLTPHCELILPKVDDCISLLMGYRRRHEVTQKMPSYFMSKGWLDGERNIWTEHEYAFQKYGPRIGQEIFDLMFANYRQLCVLDTGCCELSSLLPETQRIADALKLKHTVLAANVQYLRDLLTGPWEETRFLRVPAGTPIRLEQLVPTSAD
ncbi:MAG: DUF1638 domain-containing protein [Oscillospiraceae bacterium]|nr:DUF1638 domain-containing protein [Oscillospiraceae bacterium]